MIPVWLLDIDGVINACTKNPDRSVWPLDDWIRTEAKADRRTWPILAARSVLDFIRSVHAEGRAEIRWHTTWQGDAANLATALDLPEFPVADAPEYRDVETFLKRDAWWKRPAAERVLRDEGRPLLWTDDDATWSLGRRGADEMAELGSLLLISPNELTGLTPKHLRQIREFLGMAPERAS